MPTRLLEPFPLARADARHSLIIENLLEIDKKYPPAVLASMIEMLEDLYQYGRGSRYVRKLQGLPLSELKTQSQD